MNQLVKRFAPIVVGIALVASSSSVAAVAGSMERPATGRPVFRSAPDEAPAMTVSHHVCTIAGGHGSSTGRAHGLVGVRPHPTSVVAVWIPGLNRKLHCQAKRVVGSAHVATRLARGVERSKKVTGVYHCPLDDGTRVELYFTYEQGRDEVVDVSLMGCRFISAPGRGGRFTTPAIDRQLRQIAPQRWAKYVTPTR